MKKVTCPPCGGKIALDSAYYCSSCDAYYCWKHLKKAMLTTAKHCPSGHDVIKAN